MHQSGIRPPVGGRRSKPPTPMISDHVRDHSRVLPTNCIRPSPMACQRMHTNRRKCLAPAFLTSGAKMLNSANSNIFTPLSEGGPGWPFFPPGISGGHHQSPGTPPSGRGLSLWTPPACAHTHLPYPKILLCTRCITKTESPNRTL